MAHLRTYGGYLTGRNGKGVETSLVPIDLLFEKGFYLGPVLSMYLSAGGTGTYVRHEVGASEFGGTAQSLSAWVYGLEARLGFEVLLSTDFGLRVEALTRLHFSPAEYKTDDDTPLANDFDQREDRFSMLGANLALNWML